MCSKLQGVALTVLLALAGCTTTTKEFVAAPPERTSLVAVGRVDPTCTEWERDALRFERALSTELRASGAFPEVRSSVARALPDDALVINGTMIDADAGSDLQQMLLGIGGPAATLEIRVTDGRDRVLLVLNKSSLLARKNVDMTSWSPVEVRNLMDDLARDTAREIVQWSKGEKIYDTIF